MTTIHNQTFAIEGKSRTLEELRAFYNMMYWRKRPIHIENRYGEVKVLHPKNWVLAEVLKDIADAVSTEQIMKNVMLDGCRSGELVTFPSLDLEQKVKSRASDGVQPTHYVLAFPEIMDAIVCRVTAEYTAKHEQKFEEVRNQIITVLENGPLPNERPSRSIQAARDDEYAEPQTQYPDVDTTG